MRNPIILALDVATSEQALPLARQLAPLLGAIKIGSELFTASGPEIVRQMRDLGLNVFLDLKFHDIPNTVSKAVASAVQLDVQMLTIHTGGGSEMMKAAELSAKENAAKLGKNPPLVLGVTILTSLEEADLPQIGFGGNAVENAVRLARLSQAAGLRGVVASPLEIAPIREACGSELVILTPGIRPAGSDAGDQRRTMTPREAIRAGADYIVVGRPITGAADARSAARRILDEMS